MPVPSKTMTAISIVIVSCLNIVAIVCLTSGAADDSKIAVTFKGGHGTDPRDGGRPIILIAAALEVTPEVFREAFSGVRPAKDGKPSKEEAQRNKTALMKVLKPHGVTNERLDEVSNFYRYKPERGELWRNTPAKAHAEIEDGKVKRIVITEPGAGYSTAPEASIPGMDAVKLKVAIQFDKDMKKNGAIKAIDLAD